MYLLEKDTDATADDVSYLRLTDGRVIGPFESERAKTLFSSMFSSKPERLRTAKEVYEGSVFGDEIRLLRTDEDSLETHPFTEIYDIHLQSDNGAVVFDLPRGLLDVAPNRVIFVDNPQESQRSRILPAPRKTPRYTSIGHASDVTYKCGSSHRGQIVSVKEEDAYLVCWRSDERVTRELEVLSYHTVEAIANRHARRLATEYMPPTRAKSSRIRDFQRAELYLWEQSIPHENISFNDLEEARNLLQEIADDIGLKPPSIKLGRSTLITHSYYKKSANEITLSKSMLNAQTIIHEFAHHVTGKMKGLKEASHGAAFAGVLLYLMERHLSADAEKALDMARERGIVVNTDVMRNLRLRTADRHQRKAAEATAPTRGTGSQ